MTVHYLVRRYFAVPNYLTQELAPLNQIPSSIMHGMKAPSGPEMHQLCARGIEKDADKCQAQICNSKTIIIREPFSCSVTGHLRVAPYNNEIFDNGTHITTP